MKAITLHACGVVTLLLFANNANCQMAVVDVQSLGQLQQQIGYWRQQIDAMSGQIATMRAQLASTTGARGMGNLLRVTLDQRNYLPSTTAPLMAVTSNAAALPSELRAAYNIYVAGQTAVLPAATASLSQSEQRAIAARRSATALRASAMQLAISTASSRFEQLQILIEEIDRTSDPKAIADLQGRIAAEQVMATNEINKLAAVNAWTESNIDMARTHTAEAALATHGTFVSRLQPTTH